MSLAAIEELLRSTMGLTATSVGASTIERAVLLRTRECGAGCIDSYYEHLRGSLAELQNLIESVVVPETWFFRDEEAFKALGQLATERCNRRGPIRVLSVPCSTGEEPYSIAMTLHEVGLHGRIVIDAVDISQKVIAQARRGIFGRNAFRSQNLAFRDRFFRAVEGGYQLVEPLMRLVSFHQANLVAGGFAFASAPYDFIFCRNLLIYFDRVTQQRVMETIRSMLSADGVLFVGPAEAFLATTCGFASICEPASFTFRKHSAGALADAAPTRISRRPRLSASVPALNRATERSFEPNVKPPSPLDDDLGTAKRLADSGQLAEAAERCQRYIVGQGPSAEAYFLLGLVRDAGGQYDDAFDCYRRAIYLEPDHFEALTHLALLSQSRGDLATAERFRSRAARAQMTPRGGVNTHD